MPINVHQNGKLFHLTNQKLSYLIQILEDGTLGNLYFGKKVSDREDFYHLIENEYRPNTAYVNKGEVDFSREHLRQEYPVYGTTDYRHPAVSVLQENGSRIVSLKFVEYHIYQGKKKLEGLPATYTESEEEATTIDFILFDELINLELVLSYTVFEEHSAISRSVQILNKGVEKLHLEKVMSLSLDLPDCEYEMLQLSGSWGRERFPEFRKLVSGVQSIESTRGSSSHYQNPFLALKRLDCTEHTGEVLGFSFVYSGNFLAQVEVDTYDVSRVTMGINPFQFDWLLKSGETFQSPEVVMVYSDEGLNGMSQTYHKLYRERLARGAWRDKERPVLINNWEATGMDFTEEKLLEFAETAANDGVELFVLDDGWFGGRRHERAGLGDWVANKELLPNGITGLAQKINELGLLFGLWFEPEMVNEDSELFRSHPDWIIKVPDRQASHGRHQYVLDFSRAEVVDHIYQMVAKILREADISYVKWDMNRCITEPYSIALPPERQGEVFHRYMLGVYDIYERLTTEFPDILFEFCASGGGRFDPGMLYYSPQGWTSDDTDAVERMKIQYGTSMVYPLSMMGAHVSAVPNEQSYRNVCLKTRGNVALFGSFGYELDLNTLSEEERIVIRRQVEFVKDQRKVIQEGTFYRLLNPFETNYCAWMVVSKDKNTVIVGYYKILNEVNAPFKRLYLKGLEPEQQYQRIDNAHLYYGDELMNIGLITSDTSCGQIIDGRVPSHDFDSQLIVFKAK
ncbi:alpha-galactosidase [Candidatus Enterococcus murrayae]|uniref:Alpha-galactosidase n=1 Tax=Candidatus Enterococcus murrayae TaxID=2815321 RepID=A0ABS3HE97_9ENTE|nr:alpha-galactosidase [Enterococcus sp. MJM16]MBO0451781.1 alpha-galactosidase [Enterococcus sp. MJM16]